MKLLKCHIENFGKLSDFNYEFEDGINTIKEDNGFGKTTFACFIKAMFYGLEAKRNTKILIDRKKYEPWQGGLYGGNIEFEVNNKQYKIERFFGKKEVDDTFKLYNLSTNLESNDYSSNIGEEIFKLNKEGYERSTFISGQNMETSMNDSINAKLGNILENENDVNTSDEALKRIDEAIKNYKKTGGRGEINEKIKERTKLEKKIEQAKVDEKNLQERKNKNNELNEQIKEKQKEQEELKKIIMQSMELETKKAKLDNYEMLEKNVKESKEKLNKCESFFKNGMPTDDEIETLIDKCMLIEKCKIEIKNYENTQERTKDIKDLKELFENSPISEGIIDNEITKCNKLNEIKSKIEVNNEKIANLNKEKETLNNKLKKSHTVNLAICMISIIFIIIAVATFLKSMQNIMLPALGIGIFCFVLFLIKNVLYNKKNKEFLNKEKELQELDTSTKNLQDEQIHIQNELNDFIVQYSDEISDMDIIIQLTEIKAKYMRYIDLKNNIDSIFEKQAEMVNKFAELEKTVKGYLQDYFEDVNDKYVNFAQEMKMKKNEYSRQNEDYKEKLKLKEAFEKTNNIKEIKTELNQAEGKKEEIEEKINNISEEINKLNDEKNYNKNQIEIMESNLDTVFDVENELEELNQKIEEMQSECDILEKTKKLLETAKTEFSSHYLGGMQQSFIKNLNLINNNKMDANIDVNLNVKINEQGANKEIKYFSTGYKDLIYICMRLSLIDSLFEGEKPFIILDDPFVNLDKEKTQNALDLLKNISNKYQIIYFICHESRK